MNNVENAVRLDIVGKKVFMTAYNAEEQIDYDAIKKDEVPFLKNNRALIGYSIKHIGKSSPNNIYICPATDELQSLFNNSDSMEVNIDTEVIILFLSPVVNKPEDFILWLTDIIEGQKTMEVLAK